MAGRPVAYEAEGRFVVFAHASPPANYPEEAHTGLQLCIPFAGARYTATTQSRSGRRLQTHLGGRDALVIPPGQPHEIDWRADADVVSIIAEPGYLAHVLEGAAVDLADGFVMRDALISALAGELRVQLAGGAPPALVIESLVNLLLARAASNALRLRGASPEAQVAAPLSKGRMRALREYVEHHLASDISLDGLAEQAGMSPSHFSRRLKATLGLSPLAFVTEARLERARELLSRSRLPVATVAARVGMTHSHFSRIFAERFGCTPSAFRRSLDP